MPGIAVSRSQPLSIPRKPAGLSPYSIRSIRIAIGTMALAWLPIAILSGLQSRESLRGFSLDYAAQSRLLVVIAVLIIAEPKLITRLDLIANAFLDDKLIGDEDRPKFELVLVSARNT